MKITVITSFILACILLSSSPARSFEPQNIEPVQLGSLEIWPVLDANITMEESLLPDLKNYPQYAGAFARGPLPAVDQVFFLQNGNKKILFDAGWGKDQKIKGFSMQTLAKNHIQPEDITDILLTHMDIDHIGGLLEGDEIVFPNARIWISKPEFEAWTSASIKNRGENAIGLAKKVAEKYKNQIKLFDYGQEILPGVTALDAAGHTPGHTAFEIASDGQKMLIGGDFMHIWQIQLPLPQLSALYDVDRKKAAETRIRLLDKASREKYLTAGMHIPMISDVRKREDGGFNMREPR